MKRFTSARLRILLVTLPLGAILVACSGADDPAAVAAIDANGPGAAQPESSNPATDRAVVRDGEIAYPAGYRAWPAFVLGVHRTDRKQIRDIYVNEVGAAVREGEPFPAGTKFVMELFEATTDADGNPSRGALLKVYGMEKGEGWSKGVPAGQAVTGDWVYGAWHPGSEAPTGEDFRGCRSCHEPHAATDFVFRTGDYFASRRAAQP